VLCDLFKRCASDFKGYKTDSENVSEEMLKVVKAAEDPKNNQAAKNVYIHSAKKIAFMVRRFEEDGYTSFWF
jgi:hypothetical protein